VATTSQEVAMGSNAKKNVMKYFKKLISLFTPKKPTPSTRSRAITKPPYTADVTHLNAASIKSGEIESAEFDAALANYLGNKKSSVST